MWTNALLQIQIQDVYILIYLFTDIDFNMYYTICILTSVFDTLGNGPASIN